MNKNYALLDYDGYICKAWYAAVSRGEPDEALNVLNELVKAAEQKLIDTLKWKDFEVLKIMSGHSWKKDEYASYKANRKKDEYIGMLRDYIKKTDKEVIIPYKLEADEWVLLLHKHLKNSVVFSDDKDLHYLSRCYCKVNVDTCIQETDVLNERYFMYQLLAGDKEDNIVGIPKVGMKKAENFLGLTPAWVDAVRVYKDKGISKEECYKNLLLITPAGTYMHPDYGADIVKAYVESGVYSEIPDVEDLIIKCTKEFITQKVDEVYTDEN